MPERHQQVLVMSPVIADNVSNLMSTREELQKYLFENSLIELNRYPPNRHAGSLEKLVELGIEPQNGKIPLCQRWEDMVIIVAGGQGGLQSCGVSCMLGHLVTKKIENPEL